MQEIYLDNSATTRPFQEVIKEAEKAIETSYGNPSSLHKKGVDAERIIDKSRETIAHLLSAKKDEILFTSGGTEANNLAIKGIAKAYKERGRHIICSVIEHPSVLEPLKYLERENFTITFLPVNKSGLIDLDQLRDSLTEETILVSIMHVNNEIGTIQPIKKIGEIVKENSRAFFHSDMVQSFLRIPTTITRESPDLITLSGHKVHALKGVGVLYKRRGIHIEPLLHGGGQENRIRSGTENTIAIAGLSALLEKELDNPRIELMRDELAQKIENALPDTVINTPLKCAAPHILSISFPGLKGEVLLHSLAEEGIYLSTGSACHSLHDNENHVLKAIGLKRRESQGTLRISLSFFNRESEIDDILEKLVKVVTMLKNF